MKIIQEGNFEDEEDVIDIPIQKGVEKPDPIPVPISKDNSMTIFLIVIITLVVIIIAYINNKDNDK